LSGNNSEVRAGENEVVFVEGGAAPRGAREDGINIRREDAEIPPCEPLRRRQIAGVPRERAAADLSAGHDHLDPVARKDFDGGRVDVRIEDLLRAACKEGDACAAVTLCGCDFRPCLPRRNAFRDQVQHGTEGLWKKGGEAARKTSGPRGGAKTHGIRKCGGDDPPTEAFHERAASFSLRERAEGREDILIRDAARARGFAGEAAEAPVHMKDSVREREVALEDLLDEDDTPARRVHLLPEFPVGRACGEAEAAMNTGLHGVCHRPATRAVVLGEDFVEPAIPLTWD
jgi:hypothetical protein